MAEPAAEVPATIADLPSGDPIPHPSSATPTSKPSSGAPSIPLGALLAAAPSGLDAFLTRLNAILATPAGIDTVLLFTCYSSRLAAAVLTQLARSALRRSAREWLAVLASLPPRTTVLFSAKTPAAGAGVAELATTATAATALLVAKRLSALSTLLSEARTMLRLWALLGMYFWGKGLVAKALARYHRRREAKTTDGRVEKGVVVVKKGEEEESVLDATLAWTQLALCIGLQALENGAYLSSKGVMGWSGPAQAKAYKWSARFWAAYVGVELGKILGEGLRTKAKAEGGELMTAEKAREQRADWRRRLAKNLAWAPLTLHWSTDKGLVGDFAVGLFGSVPGVIQISQAWAASGAK
ncbi:hypothetical protein B0T22DRAFT_475141 [Podospora appendiculata]|uniref:Peroxin 11c n=1 Tax=Podospora appendiculata TaxID=314037 RepID=A0AAE0XF11_9PEZI|nr:hypothetical protein B0T22DRAFT_475141 [Podospora appendiculata]